MPQVRYFDPKSGKRKAVTVSTEESARKFRAQLARDREKGLFTDPSRAAMHFRDYVVEYQRGQGHKRGSSQERDHYICKKLVAQFGHMRMREFAVSRGVVQQWVNTATTVKGAPLAPTTVLREYRVLAAIMSEAVADGVIAQSPCKKITLPKGRQKKIRVLVPEEIERLATAVGSVNPRYRLMVLIGCFGGLRLGELMALRVKHVLESAAQLDVKESLWQPSKGAPVIAETKTEYSKRQVDLPPFLVAEIKAHISWFVAKDDPEALLFTDSDGGPVRPGNWRRRVWGPATKLAGLEGVHPHCTRHTFVSLLIDAGVPLVKVTEQAGHSSPTFTWQTYKHRYRKREVSASAAALENIRFG